MKTRIIKSLKLLGLYEKAKILRNRLRNIDPVYIARRERMLGFYSQFINKGHLCFDVGAHLGNRTEVFLRLGATIVAVEPQDDCMRELRRRYKNNNKVILIHKGLDAKEGEREFFICNANSLSSMSREWISAVKGSGRFYDYRWERAKVIPTTTLDRLIEQYGTPVFCKIDVEGFEGEVISGLSTPCVRTVCLEYTPEFISAALKCVEYLKRLGPAEFNYCIGESMELGLSEWVNGEKVCGILQAFPADMRSAGDIYARFIQ